MILSRLSRFYRYSLILLACMLPAAALAQAQAQSSEAPATPTASQLETAVVKIFSTIRSPDPFRP